MFKIKFLDILSIRKSVNVVYVRYKCGVTQTQSRLCHLNKFKLSNVHHNKFRKNANKTTLKTSQWVKRVNVRLPLSNQHNLRKSPTGFAYTRYIWG